jgi:hypothetical protein
MSMYNGKPVFEVDVCQCLLAETISFTKPTGIIGTAITGGRLCQSSSDFDWSNLLEFPSLLLRLFHHNSP